jgi:tRNA-uridine 2-sulfurtransferase
VKVLVAMSGGVDSSVAAALLREEGHEVVGATMKLWGGASDSGCCSVADVDDARRVAQQLGIAHHVFNFTDDFERHVVEQYIDAHRHGATPNPCVECNRHLKFDRFLRRAEKLGFDAVATGHHARVACVDGRWALLRGADAAKDQSYVLSMLGQRELERCRFPVGAFTKSHVRARAAELGLRTAVKPESQDVCFILASDGRRRFLADRMPLHAGAVVDQGGDEVGRVEAVELVTVGQRRGLGASGDGAPRYALSVDTGARRVVVGSRDALDTWSTALHAVTWVDDVAPSGTLVRGQTSAHGRSVVATLTGEGVAWSEPVRRVAPGQTVALYAVDDSRVLGAGIAS